MGKDHTLFIDRRSVQFHKKANNRSFVSVIPGDAWCHTLGCELPAPTGRGSYFGQHRTTDMLTLQCLREGVRVISALAKRHVDAAATVDQILELDAQRRALKPNSIKCSPRTPSHVKLVD